MRLFPATDPDRETALSSDGPTRLQHVVAGATGGFVATLVMTAYRLPIAHSLPPTAAFWAKFVAGDDPDASDDPDDHPIPALVLHLLYGTGAGALFGGLFFAEESRTPAEREQTGLLWGVGYALALSVFGERIVLERIIGMDLAPDEKFVFHVGHVIYGLTLGTWLGSRTSD